MLKIDIPLRINEEICKVLEIYKVRLEIKHILGLASVLGL